MSNLVSSWDAVRSRVLGRLVIRAAVTSMCVGDISLTFLLDAAWVYKWRTEASRAPYCPGGTTWASHKQPNYPTHFPLLHWLCERMSVSLWTATSNAFYADGVRVDTCALNPVLCLSSDVVCMCVCVGEGKIDVFCGLVFHSRADTGVSWNRTDGYSDSLSLLKEREGWDGMESDLNTN